MGSDNAQWLHCIVSSRDLVIAGTKDSDPKKLTCHECLIKDIQHFYSSTLVTLSILYLTELVSKSRHPAQANATFFHLWSLYPGCPPPRQEQLKKCFCFQNLCHGTHTSLISNNHKLLDITLQQQLEIFQCGIRHIGGE